ncbi:putative pyridoxamine 5'-phosphate oxidase family protein [Anaerotaenia torta]|uniref:pyridoxamine 5'-phosphate oxidase family protein n=1 Tax=Anaerotaenia torta TaxID=433293 RepID=UPI003D1D62E3
MRMELNYNDLCNEITEKLQSEDNIILATSANNKVTARAMAHINDGLTILFATSRNSEKVEQMRRNPNVALASGNLKIEAIAELFGHPKGHSYFINEYPKKFPHLGEIYPEKPEDILIIARPTKISLFKYLGKPCEDVLETASKQAYRIELE